MISCDAAGLLDVAVIRLPHISNYDDYDPLKPETSLRFVERAADLAAPDLIILPGTKSTVADLSWVRESGLAAAIEARLAEGVPVIGICGGYQMLGRTIRDPLGVETLAGEAAGLGLLDITTAFAAEKQTVRVRGEAAAGEGLLAASAGQPFAGYEIHHGVTMTGEASGWLRITERGGERVSLVDGAVRADGMVAGCYIHGLFDSDAFRAALLGAIGRQRGRRLAFARFGRGAAFDRLAAHVRVHLDIPAIYRLLGRPG